jgi:hypothetical protein
MRSLFINVNLKLDKINYKPRNFQVFWPALEYVQKGNEVQSAQKEKPRFSARLSDLIVVSYAALKEA